MVGWSQAWLLIGMLQAAAQDPYATAHPPAYAGVYAVRFCHGTCSDASVDADRTGTLVLSGRPLLNRAGRRMRQWMERDPVNGCLFLDPARPGGGEGIHAPQARRFRFLTWSLWPDGSRASFDLSRSPDGGGDVMLQLAPTGLSGNVGVWGGALGAVAPGSAVAPRDQVLAERIGDVDVTDCPQPLPAKHQDADH
jgi:hypothetical protein